jgi:uncharacterized membrane protein YvbJ
MKCSNCETENPEGAQFCAECGNKLENVNAIKNGEKRGFWQRKIVIVGIGLVVILFFLVMLSGF